MGTETRVFHCIELASWTVDADRFIGTAAGTSEWGTSRRHAGHLLHDALNSATPQIFDTVIEDGGEKRVLNVEATEAAKEKLARSRTRSPTGSGRDPDRDRSARAHLQRPLQQPGAAPFRRQPPDPARRQQHHPALRAPEAGHLAHHRRRQHATWRTPSASGKTFSIAAAIMEQKRLGLITKAMLVVPGHCLAQASREFLQLYPTARILVADETQFQQGQARALPGTRGDGELGCHHHHPLGLPLHRRADGLRARHDRGADSPCTRRLKLRVDSDDRTTRKRIEAMKEKLTERLEAMQGPPRRHADHRGNRHRSDHRR